MRRLSELASKNPTQSLVLFVYLLLSRVPYENLCACNFQDVLRRALVSRHKSTSLKIVYPDLLSSTKSFLRSEIFSSLLCVPTLEYY